MSPDEQSGPSPAVTIITRTKDRPALLERALTSIAGQTFRDYEVVIVNDGGDPDEITRTLERCGGSAPERVRVLHNAASMEAAAFSAVNTALRASASTYVVLHDDDDTWAPAFLELTTAHLAATGAMGVIATTDKIVEHLEHGVWHVLSQARLYPGLRAINLYEMCLVNYAAPISFLYRRAVHDVIGYFDEDAGGVGDWDFALRFLMRFDIDYLETPEAVAFYRHRPGSAAEDVNSVYTDGHLDAENRIANRYFRKDIEAGTLGLGLAMNELRHERVRDELNRRELEQAANARLDHVLERLLEVDERLARMEHALTPAERLRSYAAAARRLPRRKQAGVRGETTP